MEATHHHTGTYGFLRMRHTADKTAIFVTIPIPGLEHGGMDEEIELLSISMGGVYLHTFQDTADAFKDIEGLMTALSEAVSHLNPCGTCSMLCEAGTTFHEGC